jgi:hypothetical protein
MNTVTSVKFARSNRELDDIANEARRAFKANEICEKEVKEILQAVWGHRAWV